MNLCKDIFYQAISNIDNDALLESTPFIEFPYVLQEEMIRLIYLKDSIFENKEIIKERSFFN